MSASESDIQNLEIQAVVFASMTAMAGVYFVLFVLAMVSTYRESDRAHKRLRVVTLLLFAACSTHFISRSIDFSRARVIPQPAEEVYTWTMPLRIVETVSTTTAALLSDGLLAYRFYVIYGRKRWALYVPSVAIIVTALLGYGESLTNLAIYRHVNSFSYANGISIDVLKISAAWGWSTFFINTTLTGAILTKIIYATQACKVVSYISGQLPYMFIIEAVVESALVTWVGLLFYEIASLAPQGHYTNNLNIGYVAICILPFFFGISQCLITVRLGFTKRDSPAVTEVSAAVFASNIVSGGLTSRDVRLESHREDGTEPSSPVSEKEARLSDVGLAA